MLSSATVLLIFLISHFGSNVAYRQSSRQWTRTVTYTPNGGENMMSFQMRQPIQQFSNYNWDNNGNTFFSRTDKNNNDENFSDGFSHEFSNKFSKILSSNGQNTDGILHRPSNNLNDGLLQMFPQLSKTNWDSNNVILSSANSNDGFIQSNPQDTNSNDDSTFSGSALSSNRFSQFENECLDEHNKFRAKHGAPPLRLNQNLNNYAQEWANYLANNGKFHHRSNRRYGENLFMSGGGQIDGRTAVRAWYDEIRMYRYGSGFSQSTGHFTQVVWKGSRELGCAFARRGNSVYVVANYDPAGNVQGAFSANVSPPRH